ncbi:hypothetical protein SCHPADRAFT_940967 [Schizopora paradoxa]|uniref:Uncharacterized protein n=1 Tax=Schizopora paradoxa TaxID=27342 RepID=A0A0H2S762_9AGAM|nr:hypothetical protein SCHPADRAFT_940967 [Schizopora paradoxa]
MNEKSFIHIGCTAGNVVTRFVSFWSGNLREVYHHSHSLHLRKDRLQRYMKHGTFTIYVQGLTRGSVLLNVNMSTTLSDVTQQLRCQHLIPSQNSIFKYHFFSPLHSSALRLTNCLYDKGLRSLSTIHTRFFLVGGVNGDVNGVGNGKRHVANTRYDNVNNVDCGALPWGFTSQGSASKTGGAPSPQPMQSQNDPSPGPLTSSVTAQDTSSLQTLKRSNAGNDLDSNLEFQIMPPATKRPCTTIVDDDEVQAAASTPAASSPSSTKGKAKANSQPDNSTPTNHNKPVKVISIDNEDDTKLKSSLSTTLDCNFFFDESYKQPHPTPSTPGKTQKAVHKPAYTMFCSTTGFVSKLDKGKKEKPNTPTNFPYLHDTYMEAVICWLISTDLPLQTLENPLFCELIEIITRSKDGEVKHPTRQAV